ncbi:hypothetical protein EON66_09775 [archaeon]|nr:MAG: hypothetical protein EON66_09775 [archaeon]
MTYERAHAFHAAACPAVRCALLTTLPAPWYFRTALAGLWFYGEEVGSSSWCFSGTYQRTSVQSAPARHSGCLTARCAPGSIIEVGLTQANGNKLLILWYVTLAHFPTLSFKLLAPSPCRYAAAHAQLRLLLPVLHATRASVQSARGW